MAEVATMPAKDAPEGLQEDTVDALLDIVWRLKDEESARDQSFTLRGVGLAGFAGLVLSLSNAIARPALRADLATFFDVATIVLFVAAVLALVTALVWTLFGVLLPRESITLGSDEVAQFILPTFVNANKAMAQGREMRGVIQALLRQRSRNDAKATQLHRAYLALAFGLLALGLLGLTLAGIDAGVIS